VSKQNHQPAAASDVASIQAEFARFFEHYGRQEPMQSPEAADTDSQLKNISLLLADTIAKQPAGTVLDIGSGKGVLLQRLSNLTVFIERPAWIYGAIDFPENLESIVSLAARLRLHRRLEVRSIEELHDQWISHETFPRPLLLVLRNVLHELTIEATALLLHTLALRTEPTDTLLIQDLQVFHQIERGNVCWIPKILEKTLQNCGFSTSLVEEPTARGNRWFTICAHRNDAHAPNFDEVRATVIGGRSDQLAVWNELNALLPGDEASRNPAIARLDFDLQRAALHQQLRRAQPGVFPEPGPAEQATIARKMFVKLLASSTLDDVRSSIVSIEEPAHFRDRARSQDALEAYLRGPAQLAIVTGGAFRAPNRTAQPGSSAAPSLAEELATRGFC
jgi:hypothetical protein